MKINAKILANTWWQEMSFVFFLMLCLTTSFGTRLQWESKWSVFDNVVLDNLTYFLYATDILVFLLILFWLIDILVKFWKYQDWDDWDLDIWQALVLVLLGGLTFWSWYGLVWTVEKQIGIYHAFRLLEIFLLVSYVVLFVKNNWARWTKIIIFFGIGTVFQTVWGIGQYLWQKDFGWWWLGESILGKDVDGVAKIVVNGEKWIRAYGTMPHANVFSFFLLAGLILIVWFVLRRDFGSVLGSDLSKSKPIVEKNTFYKIISSDIFLGVVFGLIILGIMVGFSRSVWVAAVIVLVGLILNGVLFVKNKINFNLHNILFWLQTKRKMLVPLVVIVLLAVGFNYKALISRGEMNISEDISVNTREIFDEAANRMIDQNYYHGYGIGNFVLVMGYFVDEPMEWWMFQPVHNTFKLVWAELGVIGFIGYSLMWLGLLLLVILGKSKFRIFWLGVWVAMFWLNFFDHYMWDIWQGQLAFAIILGVMICFGGKDVLEEKAGIQIIN